MVLEEPAMKVLFVASGNKAVGDVSAFVQSQYDSLSKEGVDMVMYPIVGHGLRGYLKHFGALRKLIKKERPDIVHAHYSTCGYLATMASLGLKNKVVVSILGSFPSENRKCRIVRFFVDRIWNATIVKSERTRKQLGRNLPIIPNGVNLGQFQFIDQQKARDIVGFNKEKKYVIFVSNPARPEKNYPLAEKAVGMLNDDSVELFPVFNKTHDEVVTYMCAADALLMTSISEGSPNVIKEAMACNCPIVVTDVGDVHERLDGLEGCYVAKTYETSELSELVKKALLFGKRTDGRNTLLSQGLTTEMVAKRIIGVYLSVIKKNINYECI